ncbi:hypothetical protein BDF20DRAFT_861205 [Mycotypha africana]|uniref:uncharacterized protein n=1 Tax=Mycotypha africana TaxID=64632 RepID=UPI002301F7B1|nr:uncharacterized protein BDF20DRAFT_861205 [Mycotypha africana]KAI8984683.1 hypothetical protein BDF20DRAFT_861205 [Mycotypha africana]
MSDKYKNLKVKELQELLTKRDLPVTGKKEDLIERLVKHDEKEEKELKSLEEEFGDLEDFDESKVPLDSKELEDILGDESKDTADDITLSVPTSESKDATAKNKTTPSDTVKIAPKDSKTNVEEKSSSNFKFTPVTFNDKNTTTTGTTEASKKTATAASPPAAKQTTSDTKPVAKLDDAERALERAKRFGIQLNEKAKKEIRAQRFGINTNKQEVKKSHKLGIDPEVLKRRAERFGISDNAATVAASKGKAPVNFDPVEEEKKRKRAERFNMGNKKQKAE